MPVSRSSITSSIQRLDSINEPHKTVHIIIGFLFMVNYEVGTGFLGIPFAFFHGGILAGTLTMIVAAFVSWNTAIWVLEVMSRAQALEDFKMFPGAPLSPGVLTSRKFEFSELCSMFLGSWSKYVYLLILTACNFLYCLAFCTVAGSSWAVNLPLDFDDLSECNNSEFQRHTLPTVIPCRNAYWFCLFLFGCIVVPLSLIELREQMIIQVILSVLRFVTIGAVTIFSIVNLITVGNVCTCNIPWNDSNLTNTDCYSEELDDDNQMCNVSTSHVDIVTRFNARAWIISIPVMVAALNFHQGIPALMNPVKQKKQLGRLMHVLLVVITLLYLAIGISLSLWWKCCINEICTLNWDPLTHTSYSIALRIFSYFVMLFPSIDVISIYPLFILTVINNLYIVIFGKDSAKAKEKWKSFFILLAMKLIAALLPLLVAMAVSNLVTVLKYTGFGSFFMAIIVPLLLQLRSQWVCCKTYKNSKRHELLESSTAMTAAKEQDLNGDAETIPLTNSSNVIKNSELYMTPYSTPLSHWPAVLPIGAIGLLLFFIASAGLLVPISFQNTKKE